LRFQREWIGLALVIFGLVRAALLVAHDPLVGYGNQYDMHRTGACLGLFPDMPAPARYERTPDAPQPIYRQEAARPDLCYLSSESTLDDAVVSTMQLAKATANGIRLQWLGYAKLALLVITALAIAWSLHEHPTAALQHGVVVFFVMCDPVVTLWMNTMYTEFTVLWALYAAIGSIAALAVSERGAYILAGILIVALVTLAFSREQFSLLAPALAAVAFPWLWSRAPHLAVGAFGIAFVCAVISFALVPRGNLVSRVNRVDTYLGLVVPASSRPLAALSSIGLPSRCEPVVGITWYQRRGESMEDLCPEAVKLSSLAFLNLVRSDPEALTRSTARVLPATQELAPRLGTMAGGDRVAISQLPWWLRSPLHALFWRIPLLVYCWFVIAVIAVLPLAFLASFAWARPSRDGQGAELMVAMMLSGTVLYSLVTTVFGDGMSEAARHFLPGALAAIVAVLAFIAAIPGAFIRWSSEPKFHGFAIAATVLAGVVVVAAAAMSLRWARSEPLAMGLLDAPAGRNVPAGSPLELRGWALDPYGVDTIEADLSGARFPIYAGNAKPDLHEMYPSYPDSALAGFTARIPAQDLAKAAATAPPTLRIFVKSKSGATTEVERRRLEIAP
jgi:hypothetical protein